MRALILPIAIVLIFLGPPAAIAIAKRRIAHPDPERRWWETDDEYHGRTYDP